MGFKDFLRRSQFELYGSLSFVRVCFSDIRKTLPSVHDLPSLSLLIGYTFRDSNLSIGCLQRIRLTNRNRALAIENPSSRFA